MDFYIPIPSHVHAVNSHFPLFPFPSLSLISIPVGFSFGYSHFQTRTAKQYLV